MRFFEGGIRPLVSSVLTHQQPIYVQYYVTARCNLRCVQCNVIYSNGDQEECSLEQAKRIASNLASIGTSIVLLTGGEPFARSDLSKIAASFIAEGVHPRIQTNGFASREQLEEMVSIGVKDISISLDSLEPSVQDALNGDVRHSWEQAIEKIAIINEVFPADSFCSLGCVLSPKNLSHVESVVRFATEIGWWVSLVPAHQTTTRSPRSFATYDPNLVFPPEQYEELRCLATTLKNMKHSGFNLYDSDEYLDDVVRYTTRNPIRWRRRNSNRCDSPNLYFAIQPNGDMSVCCDYRLPKKFPVWHDDFPKWYQNQLMFEEAREIADACSGCMYGSFPEISISARFYRPMFERALLFAGSRSGRALKRLSKEEMIDLASRIQRKRLAPE